MEGVDVCFYERGNNSSLVDTPASFNGSAFVFFLKPRFYAVSMFISRIWNLESVTEYIVGLILSLFCGVGEF